MKRYAHARKRDGNEPAIANALKAAGCTVERIDVVDLLVGYRGRTLLLEVKNPDNTRGRQDLRSARTGRESATARRQREFREKWNGSPVAIVTSAEEALAALASVATGESA